MVYFVHPNVLSVSGGAVFVSGGVGFALGGEALDADAVALGGVEQACRIVLFPQTGNEAFRLGFVGGLVAGYVMWYVARGAGSGMVPTG